MGKNARLREERKMNKEEREAQKRAAEKKAKRNRIIRNCVLSAVSALAVVGICLGIFFGAIVNQGWYLRRVTAMKTENFTVTGEMMAYFVYNTFENYHNNYGNELGIDATKSLKKQYFREGVSWFDYFVLESQTNLSQVLLFAEKAKEQGMELTAEEKAEIAEYALSNDFSSYTEKFGFTVDDFTAAMELTTLASKMYDKAIEDLAIDDAKIEEYFKTNEKYFKMVDYKSIIIPYGTKGWYKDASAAKSAADHIAKGTTAASFDTAVREVLSAIGASASDIETELQNAKATGVYYKDNDEVSTWAFGTAKVDNTYVVAGDGTYTVYQLTKLPYIDETATVNVRHILLSSEDKAKEVLNEWKKGAATADSFAELAKKHTEDPGSKESGGLYEDVSKGEMVEAFDTWIFADGRKVGDTDIVKTDYGYHVMYFVGEGSKAWELNAENAMVAENTDKLCTEYEKAWPLTAKKGVINRLPL